MPIKLVRNDITKMTTEAIVTTANSEPIFGPGCDSAVYKAAGEEEMLAFRRTIGRVPEGEAFVTPGFALPASIVIHAVSPLYIDGRHGEEERLRSCYRNALRLAHEYDIRSIAFPLISMGSFGYPREEGLRIALDEINAWPYAEETDIYVVVFDKKSYLLGRLIDERIENCIADPAPALRWPELPRSAHYNEYVLEESALYDSPKSASSYLASDSELSAAAAPGNNYEELTKAIDERMRHRSDSFSEYLVYLIESKGLSHPDVYKRAVIDKKTYSKIRNNPDARPKKMTAMCLCIGAKLNLDETKDLLSRAGYALSPSDRTDIIFSFFIERGIYDMIELDIQLEERGLPHLIA